MNQKLQQMKITNETYKIKLEYERIIAGIKPREPTPEPESDDESIKSDEKPPKKLIDVNVLI